MDRNRYYIWTEPLPFGLNGGAFGAVSKARPGERLRRSDNQ